MTIRKSFIICYLHYNSIAGILIRQKVDDGPLGRLMMGVDIITLLVISLPFYSSIA